MAIGRAERFEERKPRVVAVFGSSDEVLRRVAEIFALMEMAWHDCYGEITPPEAVVDDVLLCSGGTLEGLVTAAHLGVVEARDLRVWASSLAPRSDP
ncbi:MAG TPA: hypothetical protein VFJ93_05845 [Gaiellaceae bacterium]|jgi:hypothetical protein|nr:hypothetical protein [Gaiellaceae bacterium]